MLMNDPHQREQAACGLGHSFLRLEDEALLTGQAQFLDDIPMEGVLHACFVRSPHAHARIRSIDLSAARALPGVHGAFTAQDLMGELTHWRMPLGFAFAVLPENTVPFVLAREEVAFVGEAIAVIVAQSRHVAEDAAALVAIDFEVLPAISDLRQALEPNAPVVAWRLVLAAVALVLVLLLLRRGLLVRVLAGRGLLGARDGHDHRLVHVESACLALWRQCADHTAASVADATIARKHGRRSGAIAAGERMRAGAKLTVESLRQGVLTQEPRDGDVGERPATPELLRALPHDDRARHQYRGINAKQDTDIGIFNRICIITKVPVSKVSHRIDQ